jgi:hypothetical protein
LSMRASQTNTRSSLTKESAPSAVPSAPARRPEHFGGASSHVQARALLVHRWECDPKSRRTE